MLFEQAEETCESEAEVQHLEACEDFGCYHIGTACVRWFLPLSLRRTQIDVPFVLSDDGNGEARDRKLFFIASTVDGVNAEWHQSDPVARYSIRLVVSSLTDTPNLLASAASRRSAVRMETSAVCATARWSASSVRSVLVSCPSHE